MEKSDSAKKRVLVVDDCPIFIKLITSVLSDEFSVLTATSGEDAIDVLRREEHDSPLEKKTYHLIITDYEMPGASGFDVADYVRGRNREKHFTPVIMLTGIDMSKEEAREHGCAAFIPKADIHKVKSMARILTS